MKLFFALVIAAFAQPALAAKFLQGNRDAKVQIVIYGDFECPFTVRLMKDMPLWEKTYGDRIGVSFADFPLVFHPNAFKAAMAGSCAEQQGGFAAYAKGLFENSLRLSREVYLDLARAQGLNLAKFEACLNDANTPAAIENEITAALAHGVSGTPNAFINGERVNGAYPFDHFQTIINSKLEE